MKNLMSRNEYLQNTVEEGFIKDTFKKGWEKIKSLFNVLFLNSNTKKCHKSLILQGSNLGAPISF